MTPIMQTLIEAKIDAYDGIEPVTFLRPIPLDVFLALLKNNIKVKVISQ